MERRLGVITSSDVSKKRFPKNRGFGNCHALKFTELCESCVTIWKSPRGTIDSCEEV